MSTLLKEKKRRELIDRFAILRERRKEVKQQLADIDAEIDSFNAEASKEAVFTADEQKEIDNMKKA